MSLKTLVAVAAGTVLATSAFAQNATEVPSPLVAIENEPAPSLTLGAPAPEPLARGVVLIPYRVENFRIVPVLGAAASMCRRASGICMSGSTTCPNFGGILATATPSWWRDCRRVSTSCSSSWQTPRTASSPGGR